MVIAVLGEEPYAESQGDRQDGLGLDAADKQVLTTLAAQGVPVVVVLVSGRPLVVTPQMPDMTALVAAWLPARRAPAWRTCCSGTRPQSGS